MCSLISWKTYLKYNPATVNILKVKIMLCSKDYKCKLKTLLIPNRTWYKKGHTRIKVFQLKVSWCRILVCLMIVSNTLLPMIYPQMTSVPRVSFQPSNMHQTRSLIVEEVLMTSNGFPLCISDLVSRGTYSHFDLFNSLSLQHSSPVWCYSELDAFTVYWPVNTDLNY